MVSRRLVSMDPMVQLVCVLIGATAAIVSIVANSIKVGESVGPQWKALKKTPN